MISTTTCAPPTRTHLLLLLLAAALHLGRTAELLRLVLSLLACRRESANVIARQGSRTLRSARPLRPLRHLVSDESVLRLELLEGLVGLVDEGEAGAFAAAELRPEAEDGDLVLGGLVQLAELLPQLVLGDVGAVGVEDVAVRASERFAMLRKSIGGGLTRPSACAGAEGSG